MSSNSTLPRLSDGSSRRSDEQSSSDTKKQDPVDSQMADNAAAIEETLESDAKPQQGGSWADRVVRSIKLNAAVGLPPEHTRS